MSLCLFLLHCSSSFIARSSIEEEKKKKDVGCTTSQSPTFFPLLLFIRQKYFIVFNYIVVQTLKILVGVVVLFICNSSLLVLFICNYILRNNLLLTKSIGSISSFLYVIVNIMYQNSYCMCIYNLYFLIGSISCSRLYCLICS